MEIINATGMEVGYTVGMAPSGRQRLMVVVKGTFSFSGSKRELLLSGLQMPVAVADSFRADPGVSATLYESDFALFKPRCDILVDAKAHAPKGHPVERLRVGICVGDHSKFFEVTGDRRWEKSVLGRLRPSRPEPFTAMPITYERAYGGIDRGGGRDGTQSVYAENPIGRGYYPLSRGTERVGKLLANTGVLEDATDKVAGVYEPKSFGVLGRNFSRRIAFAGTYDDHWKREVFPFLPSDFDWRYFQSAPEDQQIVHPSGDEVLTLLNLDQSGRVQLVIPGAPVHVAFEGRGGANKAACAVLDTIFVQVEEQRCVLTWRVSHPLRRSIFEVERVIVGNMSRAWYRSRRLGKKYYPSLSAVRPH